MTASRYPEIYARWQHDPEGFWGEAAEAVHWFEKPKKVFDKDAGIYGRWFTGGVTNTCYNALDRQVEAGRGQQPALIYDSPVTNTKKTFTYGRMLSEVQILGAMLRDFGVEKGDTVILYMPMVPEAVFAMLACARIGAMHSVVFGGFAPKELATRIDDCKPKLILSASCGIEGARVVPTSRCSTKRSNSPSTRCNTCLILQRPQAQATMIEGRDHDWKRVWEHAVNYAKTSECVPVAGNRSALHSLHLRHHRNSQGRGARQWRPSGRAQMVDGKSLRRQAGRNLVVRFRHRLGGRPLLHRLCAAVSRRDLDPV